MSPQGKQISDKRRPAEITPETVAAKIVEGINAARKKKGLSPLKVEARLARAAQQHSDAMAKEDFFDHRDKRGRGPADRVDATGYQWRGVAENIALNSGYADPAPQAVEGWLRSTGHYKNLMNPDYTETGVGVARITRTDARTRRTMERWYFTQVFARPR
jgi:uncharacterized protein YkwD